MYKSARKTRCWSCKSLDVIRWGKRSGHQRYQCKNCGLYFTVENPGVSKSNELVWFEQWIIHRQTIKYISIKSGMSERTLKRKFYSYLVSYPKWYIPSLKVVNLLLDATYFHNKLCLFVYRENLLKETVLYRNTTGEFTHEILEDLLNIMRLGIIIESITCDGHKSILRAIKEANKWIKKQNKCCNTNIQPIIVQRCLVHVQRACLGYLKRDHQSEVGKTLRAIAMTICKLDTLEKKYLFEEAFTHWFNMNNEYITQYSCSESKRKWRTHKDLYSAYITIKRTLPNMFHYLDNDMIAPTTNAIESYFSHLKADIAVHRGISSEHFQNFLRWYIWFKNRNKQ